MSRKAKLKYKNVYSDAEARYQFEKTEGQEIRETLSAYASEQLKSKKQLQLTEQLKSVVLNNEELQILDSLVRKGMSRGKVETLSLFETLLNFYMPNEDDYIDGTLLVDEAAKSIVNVADYLQLDREKMLQLNEKMFARNYELITPYVFKKESAPADIAFILSKKYPKLVYSHETALYYHGLSDVYPYYLHATVENNYNPKLAVYKEQISIVRSRKLIEENEVEYVATSLGNYIPITDMERTICDCYHPRYKMDQDVSSKILKNYFSSGDASPKKLKRKAQKIGVWDKMAPIVEVLMNYG